MYTMVPFRRTLHNEFPAMLGSAFMREFFDADAAPAMRVDVRENETGYLLEADLPGVEKEAINLNIEDDMLTISADMNTQKKEEKNGYVCSERRTGHVERSFTLEGIDVSGVKADYQNGVLLVTLPKEKPVEKKTAMKIAIGGTQQQERINGAE
ncbi:MAG: Hsp20/alpha crystallin family protein [Clostridia bacterium]